MFLNTVRLCFCVLWVFFCLIYCIFVCFWSFTLIFMLLVLVNDVLDCEKLFNEFLLELTCLHHAYSNRIIFCHSVKIVVIIAIQVYVLKNLRWKWISNQRKPGENYLLSSVHQNISHAIFVTMWSSIKGTVFVFWIQHSRLQNPKWNQ